MKRRLIVGALILGVYLSFGFYVVRGNQMASVRRFGKVVRTADDSVALRGSGLHYELPWPLAEVDFVNFNAVRTVTIGIAEVEDIAGTQFLQAADPARQSQFLTGDKNILNVQINVHYRVAERAVEDYLFRAESPEAQLQLLAESALADVVLESGVDFVHTLGRDRIREVLIREVQTLADRYRLGLDVDDVTIGSIYPPIRVKSEFLEVMNARAEKETRIHQAAAYAEQQLADARATARRVTDGAEIYRQSKIEDARAQADSFVQLVERIKRDEREGIQSYAAGRQMALRRRYIETMQSILQRVAGKVFLDAGKPVDLTIIRDPKE